MNNANIILIGKTGVGKSTLINSVLGSYLAEEGIATCTTEKIDKYSGKSVNNYYGFTLYDTEGFELNESQREKSKNDIDHVISQCLNLGTDAFIHTAWYCINSLCNRIEDAEIDIISDIIENRNLDIIIVLTQAITQNKIDDLIKMINNDLRLSKYIKEGKIASICPVVSKDIEIMENTYIEMKGISELEMITHDLVERATINAYMSKVDGMTDKADKYCRYYIGTTIVTGMSPIPFSDAAILIPIQIAMFVNINKIFEIDIREDTLKQLSKMVLKIGGATLVGKTIVSNIFKFIPGIGTLVGGVISATTSGTITTALAKSYISQLKKRRIEEFYNIINVEEKFLTDVVNIFQSNL